MELEIIPDIGQSAYDDFRKLNPNSFPERREWYDQVGQRKREAHELGRSVVPVPVDASAFLTHCLEHHETCSAEALWRYAKVLHAVNISSPFDD